MSHSDLNPVNPIKPKRAAIVISNAALSTSTGWPVGFWWSELTHPHYAFTEAGWQVDIYSPRRRQLRVGRHERPRRRQRVAGRGPDLAAATRTTRSSARSREHPTRRRARRRRLRRPGRRRRPGSDVHLRRRHPACTASSSTSTRPARSPLRSATAPPSSPTPGSPTAAAGEGQDRHRASPTSRKTPPTGMTWEAGALPEGPTSCRGGSRTRSASSAPTTSKPALFRSFAIRDGNLVTGQQNFSGAETARLILEAVGR